MRSHLVRQVLVALGVVLVIVVNALASLLPLNGVTTGEIAERFDIFFLPAGYVFSIWSLIYVGLVAYAVYQFLPSQRRNPRLIAIFPFFLLSCLANAGWLVLWHYEQFIWTVVAMVVLLVSLIFVYLRLGIGRRSVPWAETWAVRIPFGIYLGWVSVATIANVTQMLAYLGWEGGPLTEAAWAVVMLVVATVLASVMVWTRRDAAFALVPVWAFVGIGVRQAETPAVAWPAYGLAALLVVLIALGWLYAPRPSRE